MIQGKKVLVTGEAKFIGFHLAESVLNPKNQEASDSSPRSIKDQATTNEESVRTSINRLNSTIMTKANRLVYTQCISIW